LEIYLFGARMFMIMEVNEHFSFEARAGPINPTQSAGVGKSDVEFQQSCPKRNREKWLLMEKFSTWRADLLCYEAIQFLKICRS